MIKFKDLKKKLKETFSDLDAKLIRKMEAWRTRRIMKKVGKLFPNDAIETREEDNHTIHIDPSRIPTSFGKVLDVKAVELGGRNVRGKFWYASKKEDVSGITDYEIRSDAECQDAFKKFLDKQHEAKRNKGYIDGF